MVVMIDIYRVYIKYIYDIILNVSCLTDRRNYKYQDCII